MTAPLASRIVIAALAAAAFGAPLAAQGGGRGAAVPPTPPPGDADTLPPNRYFGVTEYALARTKLESLVKPGGFAVYIVTDMEGLAGVVNNGREMSTGRSGNSPDHQRFRQELTDELNAAIAGARLGGATQFFVVEGHGANNFRNVLVDKVDPDAILLRGWPRPNVMETGINSKMKMIMVVGNHPNAGTPGIIAHSYALGGPLTVNGVKLNESGISAFIGAEFGVPLGMVAGDDSYASEMKETFPSAEVVTVKTAFSGSAGAMVPFARVHAAIKAAATRAVQRAKAGQLKLVSFARPYHIAFCIRNTFAQPVYEVMSKPQGFALTPDPAAGPRCFTYDTNKAEELGTIMNLVAWAALKP
ncbi:MAG: M55 family metallopeptidase [Gemmatimonadota bacterium]